MRVSDWYLYGGMTGCVAKQPKLVAVITSRSLSLLLHWAICRGELALQLHSPRWNVYNVQAGLQGPRVQAELIESSSDCNMRQCWAAHGAQWGNHFAPGDGIVHWLQVR